MVECDRHASRTEGAHMTTSQAARACLAVMMSLATLTGCGTYLTASPNATVSHTEPHYMAAVREFEPAHPTAAFPSTIPPDTIMITATTINELPTASFFQNDHPPIIVCTGPPDACVASNVGWIFKTDTVEGQSVSLVVLNGSLGENQEMSEEQIAFWSSTPLTLNPEWLRK